MNNAGYRPGRLANLAAAKPGVHGVTESPALVEVENQFLACLVTSAGLVEALPTLGALDIPGIAGDIYSAIVKLSESMTIPTTFLTLAASLEGAGNRQASVAARALETLVVDVTMAGAYAELILTASRRRQIASASSMLAADPDSAEFGAGLDRAREISIGAKPVLTSAAAVEDFRARLARKMAGEDPPISTGLIDLDRNLAGGLRGGQVIVLAARPGEGKSALAQGIAEHVASDKNGKVALFISLEMLAHEIMERRVASESRGLVPLTALRSGELSPKHLAEVDRLLPYLAETRMEFLASYSEDLDGIVQTVKDRAKQGDIGLVVLDYLQLIESVGGSATENREQQVAKVCRRIKKLALSLQVPVLLLSQLNREGEKGSVRRRPKMSDLRESGSIEQDADIIMFIHDDTPEGMRSSDGNSQRTIIIEKQRAGARGVDVPVLWIAQQCRFANLARPVAVEPANKPPASRGPAKTSRTGPAANLEAIRQTVSANAGETKGIAADVIENVRRANSIGAAASKRSAAGSEFNEF